MVNFYKQQDNFLVEFEDNQLYLNSGKMSIPMNTLSLTIDESGIATFKKAVNGDVFFSGLIEECSFDGTSATKETIDDLFAQTCTAPTGGGGADPETTVTDVEISEDGTEMDFVNASGDTVYSVDMTQYLVDLHVTGATLSGETLILYIAGSEPVQVNLEHMLDDYYTQDETDALLDDKLDTTRFESAERAIAETFADVYEQLSGSSAGGFIELTQAEYDALSGDVDPSKIYIITDAAPINLNNYTLTSTTATLEGKVNTLSGQVTANTASIATKQNQLTAGQGITITNDVISAQADMSNYYTKSEIDNAEQATSAALNELNLRVIDLSGSTSGYAETIDELVDAVDAISATVETANEVTARALVDLENKKAEVIRMTQAEYEAASGSVEDNQLVIITDATEVNMSDYYTKQEIDDMLGQINQRLTALNG